MAHSNRNPSLPHFTSYERSGTQRNRIGRDSFLPFASCRLCLQPARAPVVACASNGDLFCRECAISDLLTQREEIKRLERERDDAKRRLEREDEWTKEEAKSREVQEFELVSMGLEGAGGRKGDTKNNSTNRNPAEDDERNWGRSRKRRVEEATQPRGAEAETKDGKRRRMSGLDSSIEDKGKARQEMKREKVKNSFFFFLSHRLTLYSFFYSSNHQKHLSTRSGSPRSLPEQILQRL